ncbi:hypothetical protein VTN02DRAFT_639 [Thermoascus thermophilus]
MGTIDNILLPRGNSETMFSSRGANGLVVSVIFTTLAIFFVSARLYTRISIMQRLEPNDGMVMIALTFSIVFMGLYIEEAKYGMGIRQDEIPPEILTKQMKVFWITIPIYNTSLICAKASILMQYHRVFPTKRMRIACWILLSVLGIYGSWAVLSAYFNCIPVSKFWIPEKPGYCLSQEALWFSNASMHIITDVGILVLPIPALLSLDLPKKQKIALMAIFAVGGFVCVTSIFRLVSLKVISRSTDPTYDNVGAATWSAVECNTGIICACLPTLRPLVSRFLPHFLSTGSGRSRTTSRGAAYGRNRTLTYRNGAPSSVRAPGGDMEYGMCSTEMERVFASIPKPAYAAGAGARAVVVKEGEVGFTAKELSGSESPCSGSRSSRN